jgi:hypothetical protein
MKAAVFAILATLAKVARADEPAPDAPPPVPVDAPPADQTVTPASAPPEALPDPEELAAQLDALATAQRRTNSRITALHDQVAPLMSLSRFITVFVDVGAFVVGGDGSGIRSDIGHFYFPQYAGRLAGEWVFMGDPLSTAINANGDPADTSNSRELVGNNLGSRNHPSLIVNAVGLSIDKVVGHGISVVALAELQPRPTADRLDVELARVEYRPLADGSLVISAGKIDSVLGIEYRAQDAPSRLTVTPSLICRYTCGRPVGVDARLERGALRLSAELANGDSFVESFEPRTTLHANALPTAAGHVQWTLPIGDGMELGASGAVGSQTNQPDDSTLQWHLGLDARVYNLARFNITAEYVQGRQQGRSTSATPCDLAPCLHYKGAYVLVDRRVKPWLVPYVRLDWRDAVHASGVEFVYESHVARATVGARFALTSRILAKFEYTYNRELGGIPQFPDDILTSSIVVATD